MPKESKAMAQLRARKRNRLFALLGTIVAVAALVGALVILTPGPSPGNPGGDAYAVINTQSGQIVFRFIEDKAPNTCRNFIGLVQSGYYDGLTWHRVVDDFVIQTGQGPSRPTIARELHPDLHNDYGTVAVARTDQPDSGSTQFYINTDPEGNRDLDTNGGGYAVFGQVTRGMDVALRVTQGELIINITFVRQATPP